MSHDITLTQDIQDKISETSIQDCKKCNLPIYEGHAYELGDDRWHINCFKCSKCNSSLGCNSNFLVLGNGNLICSNCSYNCKQCGKKIDDLAILTGDQAYCSSCFKCRACKQKIEDLRYARTSKGLFCMNCHEKLIAKKKRYDSKKKLLKEKEKETKSRLSDSTPLSYTENKVDLEATDSNTSNFQDTSGYDKTVVNGDLNSNSNNTNNNSSIKSQSDFYDLYEKSRTPTPKLNSSSKQSSQHELYQNTTRSSSSLTKDKDLPTTPFETPSLGKSPLMNSQSTNLQEFNSPGLPNSDLNHDNQGFNMHSSSPSISQPKPQKIGSPIPRTNSGLDRELSIKEIADSDDELNNRGITGTPSPQRNSHLSPQTPNALQPAVDLSKPSAQNPAESPTSVAHTKFQGKSLMILSPHQANGNDLRSPKSPESFHERNNLQVDLDSKSRSNCPSPLARANRHARVVEYNQTEEDKDRDQIDTSSSLPDNDSNLATPKKNPPSTISQTMSSPPPRAPLPSVPSVPSTPNRSFNLDKDNEDFLKGLGLEGIEFNEYNDLQKRKKGSRNSFTKTSKMIMHPTPSVTNLEDNNNDTSNENQTLGRKPSIIKTPRLSVKHKRTTSGGSNSGISGKLNLFKSKEERGHSRNFSDGSMDTTSSSIHGNAAYKTPPLPFAGHNRSHSDTNTIGGLDFHSQQQQMAANEFELRSARAEINQLFTKKQELNTDVRNLQSDRDKLTESIESLKLMYEKEYKNFSQLTKDISDLKLKKKEVIDRNQETRSLGKQSSVDKFESSRSNEHSEIFGHHPTNSSSSLVNSSVAEVGPEDTVETQKATKLKFWRRAKIGFNGANGNTNNNLNVPNGNSSNGGNQSHISPNKIHEDDDNGKKSFGSIMTKSRSTNLLDSFLSNNSGSTNYSSTNESIGNEDAPLFKSSIEKRARFENSAIPLIVLRCLKEVEERGYDIEGIYRISGGNLTIVSIEQAFSNINPRVMDDKSMNKLNDILDCDINAITSALKRYLRKIPEPLIPYEIYNDFIKLNTASPSNKINDFRSKIIDRLPDPNKQVLYMLCKHLEFINSYASINRMNYKNLSVVFAPTLARDETGEREMLDMGHRNDVTDFLFNNYEKIFS